MLQFLFYFIPLLMILFFIISLCSYIVAKIKNKKIPGTYSDSDIRIRKNMLIISSILAGVLLVVVLGFILLMFIAVAYM